MAHDLMPMVVAPHPFPGLVPPALPATVPYMRGTNINPRKGPTPFRQRKLQLRNRVGGAPRLNPFRANPVNSAPFRLGNGTILRPGDQISRGFGPFNLQHHAIYVGELNPGTLQPPTAGQSSFPYIVEITNNGNGVQMVRLNPTSPWQFVARGGVEVAKRAFARVGPSSYNVIWNNCETIANEIRLGIPLSFQVVRLAGGIFSFIATAVGAYHPPPSIGRPQTIPSSPPVPEIPSLGEELFPKLKMRRRPAVPFSAPATPSTRKRPRLGPTLLSGDFGALAFLLEEKRKHGSEIV